MSLGYVALWLPVMAVVGSLAWIADLRWGIPIRRFFLNLVAPEPREYTQGFIVGRSKQAMFFWALVICYVLAAFLIAVGISAWWMQLPLAFVEAVCCFLGMHAGPLMLGALRGMGLALDKFERMEKTIKEQGPQIVDNVVAKGKEAAQAVVQTLTPEERPPQPTEEELRQAKIDKMDELLGKKKRERDGA